MRQDIVSRVAARLEEVSNDVESLLAELAHALSVAHGLCQILKQEVNRAKENERN